MAKAAKSICDLCEHRVVAGSSFCDNCGSPTAWATHDERTAYEVALYRRKSATRPIGVAYENKVRPTSVAVKERRKLFSRRSHVPQLSMPEPKRVEPPQPAPVLKAVPDDIVVAAPAPAPVRVAKPVRETRIAREPRPAVAKPVVAQKAPEPKAAESAVDTSAVVMATKMLNKRVAELDAKVQELSRQIDAMNAAAAPKNRYGR